MPLPPFIVDSSLIPINRRAQHQNAIDVIEAHERSGAPFVLMLQSYGVVQRIVRSETDIGDQLENLLADRLPPGIGFVEIQPLGGVSDLFFNDLEVAAAFRFQIHAPSLVLIDDNWLDAVIWLIQRAEMIVVLIGGNGPGLTRELGALVDHGRTDRSVVLYSELISDPMPVLDRFPRVLSLADLDTRDVLNTFVFPDLFERLNQIRDAPGTPSAVPRTGLYDAFEILAIRCRGEGRTVAAARYLGNAVRLALDGGQTEAALRLTAARLDLVSNEEGAHILSSLTASIGELSRDDPSHVFIMARLAVLRVKTMTDVDEAIAVLDSAAAQCLEPLHRRALSALETSRAWQLRLKRDAIGVYEASHKALHLAMQAGANLEAARALHIIGVTWHELDNLEKAGRALQQACELMPGDRFNDDVIMILLRLGDVMRAAGAESAARTLFEATLNAAQIAGLPQEAAAARERLDPAKADRGAPTSDA